MRGTLKAVLEGHAGEAGGGAGLARERPHVRVGARPALLDAGVVGEEGVEAG